MMLHYIRMTSAFWALNSSLSFPGPSPSRPLSRSGDEVGEDPGNEVVD